jgi:carboxymethylenebutenolidase
VPRKTAKDFHPEVLRWFDRYVHGMVDRRGFLDGVRRYAVGGVTATMLLESLNPQFALAQQVAKDDRRINASFVEFASPEGYGRMRGYLVRPANATGRLPGVLIAHENRGRTPHIEDIARRVALDNFIAFAPDALFPLGGYPGDEDRARAMYAKLDQAKINADYVAAAEYLKRLPECNGHVGVVGFCAGGTVANMLATRLSDLGAAVPFYGGPPATLDVAKIRAPLLIHYAGNDERTNAGWPKYEAALKAAGVAYEVHIYPGTQHGFNNDTTPRYDEAAAKLAWQRTIAFFNRTLSR